MKKVNNNAESAIFYVVAFVGFIVLMLWMLGFFSGDQVEIYEGGTLNSVTSLPQKFKLSIDVDGIDYNKSFNYAWRFEEYESWLVQHIDYKVDFHYFEDSNYFYDLHVYDSKNVTVKQVIYEEDGWGWWDKPPTRVIFSDGSTFTFTGDADYKFDMYAMFIAFDNEYVNINYSFDNDNNIKIYNIERIKEVK